MPYVAFEFDAIKDGIEAACSIGAHPNILLGGLIRLYAWGHRTSSTHVTPQQLHAFFPDSTDAAVEALAAFGFLEADEGGYRIRGSWRWIKAKEARRKGGLKAKSNLIPGYHKSPKVTPASAGIEPEFSGDVSTPAVAGIQPVFLGKVPKVPAGGGQPELSRKSVPAKEPEVTPASAGSDSGPSRNVVPAKLRLHPNYIKNRSSDWRTTIGAIGSAFREQFGLDYHWHRSKDFPALKSLLSSYNHTQVLDMWRRGLKASGWHHVSTVAELNSKWDHLVTLGGPRESSPEVTLVT